MERWKKASESKEQYVGWRRPKGMRAGAVAEMLGNFSYYADHTVASTVSTKAEQLSAT